MAKDRVRVGDTANQPDRRPPQWQYALSALVVVLAVGVLWLSGGDAADRPPATASTLAAVRVPPTETSSVPQTEPPIELEVPHCERVTGESVLEFFAAAQRGDATAVEGLIAVDDFRRFSEPPHRVGDDARNRDTLLAYLTERTSEGWHLTLVSQQYHGGTGDRYANFGFVSNDANSMQVSGYGAVNCTTGQVVSIDLFPPLQPGEKRVVELTEHGIVLAHPSVWYLADETLTPNLGNPREVFSLGSFPLTPGGPNCAQIPTQALNDMDSTDVFVTVQERTGGIRSSEAWDTRPEHFGPVPRSTDNVFYQCVDEDELADIGAIHWIWFTDQDRYFHVAVALGEDAAPEDVSAVWNVLDELAIKPKE